MRRAALVLAGALAAQGSAAAADAALGEYLAAECASCHQSSGRQQGGIPAIIGIPPDQFVALMQAYRQGQRENRVMQTIAAGLSAEEIAALAAYYGGLRQAE
ncbi:hypothetical protein ASE63_12890 [Bosea sp. Root381]|nr:hypothetical protein ASE63_12890 [Bosea sp. Root381]